MTPFSGPDLKKQKKDPKTIRTVFENFKAPLRPLKIYFIGTF